MWWCQFIDYLKFETRPSSLLNFGTANSHNSSQHENEAEIKQLFFSFQDKLSLVMIRVIKASLLHNIFNNVCHVVCHVTTRKRVYTLTLYTNSRDSSSVFAGRNFTFCSKQSLIIKRGLKSIFNFQCVSHGLSRNCMKESSRFYAIFAKSN